MIPISRRTALLSLLVAAILVTPGFASGAPPARQLAYLAIRGHHEKTLALAERTPTIPLYGAPDPNDSMYASLAGKPAYEALLARARDSINAERRRLGLGAMPVVVPKT